MQTGQSLAERNQEYRRIRIEFGAFNIFLNRQGDGSPGSEVEDWLEAEWKEDNGEDPDYVSWWYQINHGHTDWVLSAVLYCTAVELRKPGRMVNGDTLLPADERSRERICARVARIVHRRRLAVPKHARNIYAFAAALAGDMRTEN